MRLPREKVVVRIDIDDNGDGKTRYEIRFADIVKNAFFEPTSFDYMMLIMSLQDSFRKQCAKEARENTTA